MHGDRQPPGQRHHDQDIAGQVGVGRNPDVAARAQRLSGDHLQGIRRKGQAEQDQRRRGQGDGRRALGVALGDQRRVWPDQQRNQQPEGGRHGERHEASARHAGGVARAISAADQHGGAGRQPQRDHEHDRRDVEHDRPGRHRQAPQPSRHDIHAGEGRHFQEIRQARPIADPPLFDLCRTVTLGLFEHPKRARFGHPRDVAKDRHRQERARAGCRPAAADGAHRRQAERTRHQQQQQPQVDQIGGPHGPGRRSGPRQPLEPGNASHRQAVERQGQGEDQQHARGALGQVGVQSDVAQEQGTDQQQERRRGDADPEAIDQPPPQHRAGPFAPSLADRARSHHLNAGEQADGHGQNHAGRRPGQRVIAQLHR